MANATAAEPDIKSLVLKINRAHHQMMGLIQQEIDRLEGDEDLTLHPGMMPLFCVLAQQDGLTLSQLAQQLEMAKSSVTGAIRRMEAAGLVTQQIDPADLRVRRIKLTSRGESLKPVCDQVQQAVEGRLDDAFAPAEFAQLIDLLSRFGDIGIEGNDS